MNASHHDISRYISINQGKYTCEVDGKVETLYTNEHSLRIVDRPGYFTGDVTEVSFTDDTSDYAYSKPVVFQEDLVAVVKTDLLEKQIEIDLKQLFPAAKAMVEHYYTVELANNGRGTLPYIRMYVLKDITFEQPGKGTVIISPVSDGLEHLGDYFKGYIFHWNDAGGTIKYETVQAWRYQKLSSRDLRKRGQPEWAELMTVTTLG